MVRSWVRRYGDLLFALVFFGLATAQSLTDSSLTTVAKLASCFVALAVALAMWQRRREPLLLAVITLASLLLRPVIPVGGDGTAYGLPSLLAAYSCAAWLDGWRQTAGGAAVAASAVYLMFSDSSTVDLGSVVFFSLLFGAPWVAGRAIRLGHDRQALLADRARLLEAQRDQEARLAVTEERKRIARELHDVVSHAISVVVLQARGGRRALDTVPAEAREAFDTIERTGSQALDEMRRLLGLLRADEDNGLLPQPTLERVEVLVDELRESGLQIEAAIEGDPRPIPPGVDVSGYRIVQEAITNSLKYAGKASVRVRVVYEDAAVVVEVLDEGDGSEPDDPPVGGGGHGLAGIRERVAILGGAVEAGPRPGGGFGVSARLPYAVTT